jgi:hypothetical protein
MTDDSAAQALSRIEAALARLTQGASKAQAQKLANARAMVALEVDNERLREAVGEALAQIDGLIAKVESAPVDSAT